jgi:hypothetical protein
MRSQTGPNPTTFIYNTSAVKIYNAPSRLMLLNIFLYFDRTEQRWPYRYKFRRRRIGSRSRSYGPWATTPAPKKNYNATSCLVRVENKDIFIYHERTALAYIHHRWRCSRKFLSRRIGSWSRSYDPKLQHQRWKNYNATSCLVRFKNKDIFIYYKRTALAYITAGVVVVNFEVVGMATGVDPTTLSDNTSA